MTLQQAIDRIKLYAHHGDTTVTSDAITDTIIRAINDARRDILLEVPRAWLRKTGTKSIVQGTATYALASDVQEPLFFWYTINNADKFLIKVDNEEDFRKLISSNASQNNPTHYFDAGIDSSGYRQIIVGPVPLTAFTLNYTYYKIFDTDELTTSGLAADIPEIPSHMHNAVWKGGLYYFAKSIDDAMLLQTSQADYVMAIQQIRQSEDKNSDHKAAFKFGDMQVRKY